MGHESHPEFVTLHVLRIKGFAPSATLADMAAQPESAVQGHLGAFADRGHVKFRDNRGVWQLTPDGRAHHGELLADEVARSRAGERLAEHYEPFLALNDEFKAICADWQLRDGVPNDHADRAYDREVIARLEGVHRRALPVVTPMSEVLARLGPYAPRLDSVLHRLLGGDTTLVTGVMCGSYHDIWMELHEDLLVTQGIDRSAEGSF